MPARLVDHTHKVGYDQCIVGRRCCFVQCDECGDAGIAGVDPTPAGRVVSRIGRAS